MAPKAYKRARSSSRGVSAQGAKLIAERAISRSVEHKYSGASGLSDPIVNNVHGGFFRNLMPCPEQSITKHGRIGAEIIPTGGIIKGFVNFTIPPTGMGNPLPNGTLMVPTYLKFWIFEVIQDTDFSATGAVPVLDDFLMDPVGTVQPLFSNLGALLLDVNNLKYKVKMTKLIKLSAQIQDWHPYRLDGSAASIPPGGTVNTAFTGVQALGGEGEFSKSFYFDYGKHFKKHLKFMPIENAPIDANCPMNQALWMVVQPVYSNSSSMALGANQLKTEIHWNLSIKYNDA